VNYTWRVGRRLTLSVLLFGLAVWAFGGLLEEVLDDESLVRWDKLINGWIHAHTTPAGLAIFNAITTLGSVGAWLVVAVVAVWLWRRGDRLLLNAWLWTNLGGLAIQLLLKALIHRTRPEYAAAYLHGQSYSFPSGHAMQSTITYFLLVVVMSQADERWREWRRPLYAVATVLVLLIGVSRVYLSVHYPSDVVGGFAAGAAWLTAALALLDLARGRAARTPPLSVDSQTLT
jgi:undecaprenyl-diphosphatase